MPGSFFYKNTWHGQAMKHFREIYDAPGGFKKVNDKGLYFLEKRLPDGRGIRLQLDYKFKGFVE
jgi:filamentous hemagglutinin